MRAIVFLICTIVFAWASFCAPIRSVVGGRQSFMIEVSEQGYSAADYVQDGLVAMWDGIENADWGVHDAEATSWKDLIGTRDAVLAGNYSWLDNCIHRASDSSTSIVLPDIAIVHGFYIEYCCALLNAGGGNYRDIALTTSKRLELVQNSNGSTSLYFRNSNGGYVSRAYRLYIATSTLPRTFGFGFTDAGVVYALNGNGPYWDSTVNTILDNTFYGSQDIVIGKYRSLYEDAYYYSIRVYDRPLSVEEIAHNYEIDRLRFGL